MVDEHAERKMLPEIYQTVNGLYERATDLARTLHAMDSNLDAQGLVHAMNEPGLGAAIDFALIERRKTAVLS